ncbi:MAG TPA: hypothetical protein VFD94_04030 [Jatrophihabitans sp.]|nr:hypothetical protein [Jatrophihabitans sp.]
MALEPGRVPVGILHGVPVVDVVFVVLTVAIFALLAVVAKGAERL